MANSVVRLDKVKSCYGGHIYSVLAPETMQNGFVAALKGLKDGEREIYEIQKAGTEKPVVLIAHSPIVYDNARQGANSEQNYEIESGEVVRAYELQKTDIFSVTKEGLNLTEDAKVGNFVVAESDSFKLKEVSTTTGSEAFIGKIVRTDVVGSTIPTGQAGSIGRLLNYVVIEVIKND
ncbi:hypothetical protein JK635_01905 [Neobacillus sp. YIM B02564]|uniref:Uncharacterized protein n=1 Tax=Neobacillus paridis TaxID=2803862 RepID=A0ABS1TI56_9BACI|nr:hypothetical protein [Neobacillus paridis]MBL4950993.1 hypothetical protein [Neobacillus paridis]